MFCEPYSETTCLSIFIRPAQTKAILLQMMTRLAWNLRFSAYGDYTVSVTKAKVLVICITMQLVCVLVIIYFFSYAKSRFPLDVAQIMFSPRKKQLMSLQRFLTII